MSSPNTTGSLPDSLMPAAFMTSEEAYNTVVGNYAVIGSLAVSQVFNPIIQLELTSFAGKYRY